MLKSLFKSITCTVAERSKRHTALADVPAHHDHSFLYGDGVNVNKEIIAKTEIFELKLSALFSVALME